MHVSALRSSRKRQFRCTMRCAARARLLGLDPLHIANEGQFLAVVAPESADAALRAMRAVEGGESRQSIGEVRAEPKGRVVSASRTAERASSTCWSAIRFRAFANDGAQALDIARTRFAARPYRRAQRVLRTFLRRDQALRARARGKRDGVTLFREGGRLLAFGRGPYATDAQHVRSSSSIPVLVGKRALPALDVSASPFTP